MNAAGLAAVSSNMQIIASQITQKSSKVNKALYSVLYKLTEEFNILSAAAKASDEAAKLAIAASEATKIAVVESSSSLVTNALKAGATSAAISMLITTPLISLLSAYLSDGWKKGYPQKFNYDNDDTYADSPNEKNVTDIQYPLDSHYIDLEFDWIQYCKFVGANSLFLERDSDGYPQKFNYGSADTYTNSPNEKNATSVECPSDSYYIHLESDRVEYCELVGEEALFLCS